MEIMFKLINAASLFCNNPVFRIKKDLHSYTNNTKYFLDRVGKFLLKN